MDRVCVPYTLYTRPATGLGHKKLLANIDAEPDSGSTGPHLSSCVPLHRLQPVRCVCPELIVSVGLAWKALWCPSLGFLLTTSGRHTPGSVREGMEVWAAAQRNNNL